MTDVGIVSVDRRSGQRVTLTRRLGRSRPSSVLLAIVVVVLVVLPMLALLRAALDTGLAGLLDTMASSGAAIWASLWTSLAATLVAVGLGTTAAVVTERTALPGRRWLRIAMLVAFIVPGYVAAMGWLAAYGPGGLLDDVAGLAAPALVGPLGVIMVLGVEAMPLTFLVVAAGLAGRAEPDLERAARASGAGPLMAFRSVTLPLLGPYIGGAAAIAFVLSVTSFGVPAVLGIPAGLTTMTTRIYRDLAFAADAASFTRSIVLALVLAAVAIAFIIAADALLARRREPRSGAFSGPRGHIGRRFPPASIRAGGRRSVPARRIIAGLAIWLVVAGIVVWPLLALLLTALSAAPGLAPTPANWTLDNFAAVANPRTLSALLNSVGLSGAAALGVVVIAGLVVVSRRGDRAGLSSRALGLTFAVPGSTLAVAILLAYGVALRDTLLIILIAYLAKFWALGYRPIAAGLDGMPADLVRAARVSGASQMTATRTVVLPLLRPVVVAGAVLVFMFGLHEVTMSSLLYGPGSATLGVIVLNLQQLGDASLTAALAVLVTLVISVAAIPLLAGGGALERLGWRR